jgi:7-carboxy-7-deazaguanine synthase
MIYQVNEIFDSVQGEGIDTGKYCTFIRFAGCNLACPFCDTEFIVYKQMDISELLSKIKSPNIVLTGGEPLLRNLKPLVGKLMDKSCHVTVETNGTIEPDYYITQTCNISLSPKVPRDKCKVKKCTSLKILYPFMPGITARDYFNFKAIYRSLQLIDADRKYVEGAIEELKKLPPVWRMGIQIHKLMGVK